MGLYTYTEGGHDEDRLSDADLEDMRSRADRLFARADYVEEKVKNEVLQPGRKRNSEVEYWLQEVGKMKDKKQEIEKDIEDVFQGMAISIHIDDLKEKVKKFTDKCTNLLQPNYLPVELTQPIDGNRPLNTTPMKGRLFEENLKQVLSWLDVDGATSIGVYGMGGVGKTTLAKHVQNKLCQRFNNGKCSGYVYWVTVSHGVTLSSLQSKIAKQMGLENQLSGQDEEVSAAIIKEALERRGNCVLILDDMWEPFQAEEIGIPIGENGFKLLVTARSKDVCRRLGLKETIYVKCLNDDESWDLFREKLGNSVKLTQEVEDIARMVAKECKGLPIAIVTIASSMRGEDSIREWRNLLKQLQQLTTRQQKDMEKEVLPKLQFSYDRLGDPQLQDCFLCCAFYPEDHYIEVEELIACWTREALLEGIESREDRRDEGRSIVNRIVNACLLEYNDDKDRVKMHDLVREMAVKICRGKHFLIRTCEDGTDILRQEEWTEDLCKVSLMHNGIKSVSPVEPPNCPNLKTLLLGENCKLKSISSNFFSHLTSLRVLDLKKTGIESLPESISDLVNLTDLLLSCCIYLTDLPSLSKLQKLTKLDLSGTRIESLPESISDLVNLTDLLLSECKDLTDLPSLSKLQKLTKLDLCGTRIESLPESISDLVNLTDLRLCHCKRLTDLPSLSKLQKLRVLHLTRTRIKSLPGSISDLVNLTDLMLGGCESLTHLPSLSKLQKLRELYLVGCRRLKNWPDGMGSLRNLKVLACIGSGVLVGFSAGSDLQELQLEHSEGGGGGKAKPLDLKMLEHLEVLSANWKSNTDFNAYVTSERYLRLHGYSFIVGTDYPEEIMEENMSCKKFVMFCECRLDGEKPRIPFDVEVLGFYKCVIGEESSLMLREVPQSVVALKVIRIYNCKGPEFVLCSASSAISGLLPVEMLRKLEKLRLKELDGFEGLVKAGVLPPPDALSNLRELEIWSCNDLKWLFTPTMACNLQNLTDLLLSNCKYLTDLPSLSKLQKLTKLDLRETQIQSLPESISGLENLTALLLSNCKYLTDLPSLSKLQKLTKLDLSGTRIESLPESISDLVNLTDLLLSECKDLTHLPSLSKLQKLTKLDLCGTRIESLPESISDLVNLTDLLLCHCRRLTDLTSLSKLQKLRQLHLSSTGIKSLPESISDLVNLTHLVLVGCWRLKNWPDGMGSLRNLKVLDCIGSGVVVVFSAGSDLEELQLEHSEGGGRGKAKALDLKMLEHLEELSANWKSNTDFNAYVTSEHFLRLDRYSFIVGTDYPEKIMIGNDKAVMFCGCRLEGEKPRIPFDVEVLGFYKCVIGEESSLMLREVRQSVVALKEIWFCNCKGPEFVLCSASSAISGLLPVAMLRKLEKIGLVGLDGFKGLVKAGVLPPPDALSNLRELEIWSCNDLKWLLTPTMAGNLQNLSSLMISDCKALEEVIGGSDNDVVDQPRYLPKLEFLKLSKLPNLKSIMSGGLSKLRELRVQISHGLKWLFTPTMAGNLQNLSEPSISNCEALEEVIGGSDNDVVDQPRYLPKLEHLRLEGLPNLKSIRSGGLSNLRELKVNSCHGLKWHSLTDLPSLSKLQKLTKLDLRETQIQSLPESISGLENLTDLVLSNCKYLTDLPSLSKLHKLTKLDLSGTRIESLPESISDLVNLTDLLLGDCESLTHLPSLSKLQKLTKLDVSRTRIESLPESISGLGNLTDLLLSNCKYLTDLPSLSKLQKLTKLDLSGTRIESLPESISDLVNLTDLLLSECKDLTDLPSLSKLQKLTKLDLCGTRIESLPESISDLVNLTDLRLCHCKRLTDLPSLSKLQKLRVLHLTRTRIKSLPGSISDLVNLTDLMLGGCESLTHLPSLSKLQKLTQLILIGCRRLKNWPDGMGSLRSLKILACIESGVVVGFSAGSDLEELQLEHSEGGGGGKAKPLDLKMLKHLEVLWANWKSNTDFNAYVTSESYLRLHQYCFIVGTEYPVEITEEYTKEILGCKHVIFWECRLDGEKPRIPFDVESLMFHKCVIGEESSLMLREVPQSVVALKEIRIYNCKGPEFVLCSASSAISGLLSVEMLRVLEKLRLKELDGFKGLVKAGALPPPDALSHLRELEIWSCNDLKWLFTRTMAGNLQNLRLLRISNCEALEEVIGGSDNDVVDQPRYLPKLENLWLAHLPNLKRICPVGKNVGCDSIERRVEDCPMLEW